MRACVHCGFRFERLEKKHPRARFRTGVDEVDEWLSRNALQHQKKHLSVTRVLLDETDRIAEYYTLATRHVNLGDLPLYITKKLPKLNLPVTVLPWLGVSSSHQGTGLGTRLLAQCLNVCHSAGQTFAIVSVILNCLNDDAKRFYQRWGFE